MKQITGDTDGASEAVAPQTFARDFLEWMEFKETGIDPAELPRPTTWHVLIFPKQPKQMSAGGIALPSQAQDVEAHLNYIGQVVAMGPLCGQAERFRDPRGDSQWNVKVGDWVIYGRYAGMQKTYKGVKLLTVNDDDITDVITSPAGFKVYV